MRPAVDRGEVVVGEGTGQRHVGEVVSPRTGGAHQHQRHRPPGARQRRDALAGIGPGHPSHPQQVVVGQPEPLPYRPDLVLPAGAKLWRRRLRDHCDPVSRNAELLDRVVGDRVRRNDHARGSLHRQVAQPEAQPRAQVFAPALERHEVVQRHHHRHRAAEHRAVDPGGVEDLAVARLVGLDDLASGVAQRLEQAPCVAPDPVRVLRRAAVERDPHQGRIIAAHQAGHSANPAM